MVNALYLYIQDFKPEQQHKKIVEASIETVIILLAPLAPHLAEELWERIEKPYSIFNADWPTFDETKTRKNLIPIVVQINGKVRSSIEVEIDLADEEVLNKAFLDDKVRKHLDGKTIIKKIVVKNRLVNLVVK